MEKLRFGGLSESVGWTARREPSEASVPCTYGVTDAGEPVPYLVALPGLHSQSSHALGDRLFSVP